MRRYAQDTQVAVGKSRSEIDSLLRAWGCSQCQWSDDWSGGRVQLRFVFERSKVSYLARFDLKLPDRKALEKDAVDGRSGLPSERKLEKLLADRGRVEHRLLLLWLKAALNAVEQGLVAAETIFLPFLEGKDGATVAEVALPQLEALTRGSASRLLPAGKP